jgi:hypothetical protein
LVLPLQLALPLQPALLLQEDLPPIWAARSFSAFVGAEVPFAEQALREAAARTPTMAEAANFEASFLFIVVILFLFVKTKPIYLSIR